MNGEMYVCVGCGARFPPFLGPVHDYMESSPACWRAFGDLLAAEYATPALLSVHRLSVDAYAVQHPGGSSRAAIQSVGLHLARLMASLENPAPPKETNAIMLRFTARKSELVKLEPPSGFAMTIADVVPFAGGPAHGEKVTAWAKSALNDWRAHHAYIRRFMQNA